MTISAVVPVWNGRELLGKLLDSLERQMAASRGARVIAMGCNAGFAPAVNRGIREAKGEWIAVLNSDVELAPDYFARLSATDAWFATGKILSTADPGRIDGTFDAVSRGGVAWRVGSGCTDGPAFAVEQPISLTPWTAALFRAELFRRVGLLEDSFESYYEDVDFGLRCAALQLEGRYIPEAVAWHRGSAALGRWHPETVRRIARNQMLLLRRHFPPGLRFRWLWPIVVAQGLWGAVALRHGAGWAWVSGKWEGLTRQPNTSEPTYLPEKVLKVLCRSGERLMRGAPGPYWRLYFLLTGGEAK
jgi:GT2 family glycosyltransferase